MTPAGLKPGELARIARELCRAYSIPPPEPSGKPLDELVATILSQHTSDRNSHRAFRSLKRCFPRWSDVLGAGERALADAIRCGGLADQKAPRIVEILGSLPAGPDGEPTLDHLRELGHRRAFDVLTGFPGVGPKTAACVLLFAYGWPAFPVDTHVHRVVRRLGWAAPRDAADKVQSALCEVVPPELTYPLHVGLVRHGRETCRPRDPRCHACVLEASCAYRRGREGQGEKSQEEPRQVQPPAAEKMA